MLSQPPFPFVEDPNGIDMGGNLPELAIDPVNIKAHFYRFLLNTYDITYVCRDRTAFPVCRGPQRDGRIPP